MAGKTVTINGLRTNFRAPDVFSFGLGGGSIVRFDPPATPFVGPLSVGNQLGTRCGFLVPGSLPDLVRRVLLVTLISFISYTESIIYFSALIVPLISAVCKRGFLVSGRCRRFIHAALPRVSWRCLLSNLLYHTFMKWIFTCKLKGCFCFMLLCVCDRGLWHVYLMRRASLA